VPARFRFAVHHPLVADPELARGGGGAASGLDEAAHAVPLHLDAKAVSRHVTLYHSPNTRSSSTLILLEELGADYAVRVLDPASHAQRGPEYLAINPLGKVPAIVHGDAVVTEQVAIFLYLADLYPEAQLAPPVGDPLRGPYLRWMAFHGTCFEPAVVDRAQSRGAGPSSMSSYGDFDTMLAALTGQLSRDAYLLGESFGALDVLWGTSLAWMTRFGLVPLVPVIKTYVERVNARPSIARVREKDAKLSAAFA